MDNLHSNEYETKVLQIALDTIRGKTLCNLHPLDPQVFLSMEIAVAQSPNPGMEDKPGLVFIISTQPGCGSLEETHEETQ